MDSDSKSLGAKLSLPQVSVFLRHLLASLKKVMVATDMAVFFPITIWISVVALDLIWMLWPRCTVQVCVEQHFLASWLICLWECKPLVLSAVLLLVSWFYSSFHAAHNPIVVALPLMVLSSDVSFWKKMPLIKYPMQLHFDEILKASWILKEQTKRKAGSKQLRRLLFIKWSLCPFSPTPALF